MNALRKQQNSRKVKQCPSPSMESAIHIFFRSKRIKLGALHTQQRINDKLKQWHIYWKRISYSWSKEGYFCPFIMYDQNHLLTLGYQTVEQSLLPPPPPHSRRKDLAAWFFLFLVLFMLLHFFLVASIESSNCTPASTPIEIINALARVNTEDKNSEYILIKSKITINLDPYLKVICLV